MQYKGVQQQRHFSSADYCWGLSKSFQACCQFMEFIQSRMTSKLGQEKEQKFCVVVGRKHHLPSLLQTSLLCSQRRSTDALTLRLLMSYIYGAPSKARNANVVYIWTYVFATLKQFLSICCTMFQHWINAERFPVSHFCANTLPASWQSVYTQMWHRKPLCIDSVLKHCAANRKRLFQRCQT